MTFLNGMSVPEIPEHAPAISPVTVEGNDQEHETALLALRMRIPVVHRFAAAGSAGF